MTPCALVGLGFLAALGVIVWQAGTIRGLRRQVREHAMVGRVLHERRVEEP